MLFFAQTNELETIKLATKILKESDDLRKTKFAELYLAAAYAEIQEHEKAKEYLELLMFDYAANDSLSVIHTAVEGLVCFRKNERLLPFKKLSDAAEKLKAIGSNDWLAYIYRYLSRIYISELDYTEALDVLSRADSLCRLNNRQTALALNNKFKGTANVLSAVSLRGVNKERNLNAALKLFLSVKKHLETTGDQERLAYIYTEISDVYLRLGQIDIAYNYQQNAMLIAKQLNRVSLIRLSFNNFGEIHLAKGDNYRAKQIIFAQAKLETEELLRQNLESERRVKINETSLFKIWVLISLLGVLFFIVILFFIIWFQRLSVKSLEVRNSAVVEQRRQIASFLHRSTVANIRVLENRLAESGNYKKGSEELVLIEKIRLEARKLMEQIEVPDFENLTLPQKVDMQIFQYKKDHDVEFSISTTNHQIWKDVDPHHQLQLFCVIHEAMNNILHHSKAQSAEISIMPRIADKTINVQIYDNGIGFNPKAIRRGVGLREIESRVKELKGEIAIDSTIGSGTTIIVTVPLWHTNWLYRKLYSLWNKL